MDAESLRSNNDDTAEVMYSTGEVAKRLGVGPAMVRKWALAYESATGDKVKLRSKRDGRYFTGQQVNTILAVKKLVDNEGIKIDTALRMFLAESQLVPAVLDIDTQDIDTSQALQAILEKNDETNRLLLEEIRGLRQDLTNRTVPQALPPHDSDVRHYSYIQQLVKRLFRV